MLEIGTKHIIAELYAIVLIADGKTPDYEKIQWFDFGINIQNLLAQEKFKGMLLTEPINIKLSDWRNAGLVQMSISPACHASVRKGCVSVKPLFALKLFLPS